VSSPTTASARFNYEIGEVFEAGVALTGSEVSRCGRARRPSRSPMPTARAGEIWLVNANIPEYLQAGRFNHLCRSARAGCCCTRIQINKLMGAVER
jgi:SsrA-binding protein